MAITFGDFKTKIQRLVNRPSAENLDYIGDAIVTAIKFYESRPVFFTEKIGSLTLLSGDITVDQPTDFKSLIGLEILVNGQYIGKRGGFKETTMEELRSNWLDPTLSNTPVEYALFNDQIYFNCLANQDYTMRISYNYGDVTYPESDGDISVWFADAGVDIIKYEAMALFYADRLHDYSTSDQYKQRANGYFNNLLTRSNTRRGGYTLNA